MRSTIDIPYLNDHPSSHRIIIVGGGIVGAALAFHLSSGTEYHIVLIDRCLEKLLGSTGHAPGFVGQLNESSVLTKLAKDTVSEYLSIPGGFNPVGGLELSSTPSGVEALHRRRDMALAAGLPAEIVTPEAAASLAPDFINPDSVKIGLHFPSDGTANAQKITSYYFNQAQTRGVDFLEATVTGFTKTDVPDGHSTEMAAIQTAEGDINVQDNTVILATGIWTSSLTDPVHGAKASVTQFPIPIVPVAHPYTFTPPRTPRVGNAYPFVRWPDHHVYARDHGDRDGLGSYNHSPIQLNPMDTAIGTWPSGFDQVLSEATSNLKNGDDFHCQGVEGDLDPWLARKPFNGIFSVTPDNLSLAGRVPDVANLWMCAAIWVTTAAGTAKLVSREILRGNRSSSTPEDELLMDALSPARFQGIGPEILTLQALGKYNDIYNRKI
jgi:glycine/D-amino acid oxidase-like deaminating enzyme